MFSTLQLLYGLVHNSQTVVKTHSRRFASKPPVRGSNLLFRYAKIMKSSSFQDITAATSVGRPSYSNLARTFAVEGDL